MPSCRGAVVASLVGLASWVAFESSACAEATIRVEARGELMRRFNDAIYGGPGLEVAGGWSFDTYPIMVIPEIAVESGVYPGDPVTGSLRVVGGIRVGAALEVEPTIYVRGGYAQVWGRDDNGPGATFEAGASLDKRLQREITIGGSLGYQGFFLPEWAHGFAGGFHVGFWL